MPRSESRCHWDDSIYRELFHQMTNGPRHMVNTNVGNYPSKPNELAHKSWTWQSSITFSCHNRCNKMIPIPSPSCSCKVHCLVYRNCCDDFSSECPLLVKQSLSMFRHMLDLPVDCLAMSNSLVITGCPQKNIVTNRIINTDSFFDIINNVPITDNNTGLVFLNMDVYDCNVPKHSNAGVKWKIAMELNETSKLVQTFQDYKLHSPLYVPPRRSMLVNKCIPRSMSVCNTSIYLQQQCQSFVLYLLLKQVIYNSTLCQVCRPSLTHFKMHTQSRKLSALEVLLSPDNGLLTTQFQSWTIAKCDKSRNASLSKADCKFVKCSISSGFYLHFDGSCRRFTLFHVGLSNGLISLSQTDQDDVLDCIAYYVLTIIKLNIIGLFKPIFSHYIHKIQQNISIATFMIDFNSSTSEDLFYYSHKKELSKLATNIRKLIQIRLTPNSENDQNINWTNSTTLFEVWEQNVTQNINEKKSTLKIFRWCNKTKYANDKNKFSYYLVSPLLSNNSYICLCREKYQSDKIDDECINQQTFKLDCYRESNTSSYTLKKKLLIPFQQV
ncbi:hypothetical protein Btru_076216 [Bulinus truncatus]|nr:hypothetical protein Btru_076216 [Bulinus truncatus]